MDEVIVALKENKDNEAMWGVIDSAPPDTKVGDMIKLGGHSSFTTGLYKIIEISQVEHIVVTNKDFAIRYFKPGMPMRKLVVEPVVGFDKPKNVHWSDYGVCPFNLGYACQSQPTE